MSAKKNEKYLAVCRQHWTAHVIPGVVAVFGVIGALESLFEKARGNALAMILIAGLAVLYIFIQHKFNYIAVTEKSVVGHIGFIKSRTLSAPLSKIQNIGIGNGLFGKIFGYHTITVDNGGGDRIEFVFKNMAKAPEFVEFVQEKL